MNAQVPVLDRLMGQPQALAILKASLAAPVHAYLLHGPAGAGKSDAARAFAAALVCPSGGCGVCPSCHDVAGGLHPDVTTIEREGASISVDEAREIAMVAQRSPNVAQRQVVILNDFHLVANAAPALLKTIEEPPATTVFIVLADALVAGLVTIASRCVPVPFVTLSIDTVTQVLIADGVDNELAAEVAAVSQGNIDRARLLINDGGFHERQERWRQIPDRLDGTGAAVALVVGEVLTSFDEILDVLKERQKRELLDLNEAAKQAGERSVRGLKAIEDRHKREQRRVRTDELRAGLGALADVYRTKLAAPNIAVRRITPLVNACQAIDESTSYLSRNPNETLLLQALFLLLGDLAA